MPDRSSVRHMAKDRYIEHLRSIPLFEQCTDKQLNEVLHVADKIGLPPGHVLTRQGDIGVEMLLILDGTADVSRDGAVVSTVGAGQFIGEMAVLSDSRRNATVVARSELEVLVLTRRGLDQLLDDVPGFAKALLREVVARVARPESVAGVL
jgi:CRP/FNR family cyclic AMP-dependent transcriptional regulator